jgi:phage shock protein A
MKQKAKQNVESVRRQADNATGAATQLQTTLETIERKLEDLKARKTTLAAQVRRARETGAEGGQRFGGGTLDELEHLSGRIDQLEAEVEAADVLDDPKRASVEARFRELEKKSGGTVVEDELSALKKRLEGKS